jgi:hypothetical protein
MYDYQFRQSDYQDKLNKHLWIVRIAVYLLFSALLFAFFRTLSSHLSEITGIR